ncbi:hypothetical protein Tco_0277840 [Tanacetum coccineum]
MTWLEQLELHLHDLYLNNSSYVVDAFKPAFCTFFDEEHQTFRLKMFHNLDQLRLQLEIENLLEVNAKTYFEEYTLCEPDTYRRDLLENLDTLEAIIHRAVITYGILHMKENEVNALKHESLVTESTTLEANLNTDVKALDAGSVITESSGRKSNKHDTSSSSGNYITHAVDVDIRLVNDQVPFAEVQLTTQHNVLANEQQHTEKSEPIYDTYLLKKVDINTTLDSTNMCHRGGEIDQDAKQYQVKRKPVLQPLKNQSVVRQPTAFRPERPKFSKPRFASQVDVNNVLSKPITSHYLPKVREYVFVKPNHVIASGSSRKSSKESYRSNDMAHNYYLEETKTKTQDKNMNLKASVMHTTILQNTTNGSKPKPRRNNQTSRSLHVPKSSCGMSNGVPLVKSRAKVQSLKTRNNNKPIEPKSHTQKPGRIFKIGSLRWIPTGKMFTDSTTKVLSEPLNISNKDITKPYECDQTLNISADTLNLSTGLILNPVLVAPYVPPNNKDLEFLFQLMFDECFEPPSVERPIPPTHAVQVLVVSAGIPSSTTIDQDAPYTSHSPSSSEVQAPILHQGVAVGPTFEDNPFAQVDNDPFVNVFAPKPSSEESSLGDVSTTESNQ